MYKTVMFFSCLSVFNTYTTGVSIEKNGELYTVTVSNALFKRSTGATLTSKTYVGKIESGVDISYRTGIITLSPSFIKMELKDSTFPCSQKLANIVPNNCTKGLMRLLSMDASLERFEYEPLSIGFDNMERDIKDIAAAPYSSQFAFLRLIDICKEKFPGIRVEYNLPLVSRVLYRIFG